LKRKGPIQPLPVPFEDALRALMQTKPPPSSKKAKAKKRK
jgi:hypothetical protein